MASTSTPSTSTRRGRLRPNSVPATEKSHSLVLRRTTIRLAKARRADEVDSSTSIPRSCASDRAFTSVTPSGPKRRRTPSTAAARMGLASSSRKSP